jgi:hypothetical protein
VNVLNGNVKKGLLSGSSQEVLGLLDPLLPLLVRGLASRHMGTVQVSLNLYRFGSRNCCNQIGSRNCCNQICTRCSFAGA